MAHIVASVEKQVVLSRLKLPRRSIHDAVIRVVMLIFLNINLMQHNIISDIIIRVVMLIFLNINLMQDLTLFQM